MLKADLREIYINKRNELHGADRLKLDDLLLIQFQQINFEGIQTVLTYWPMANKSEPNTHLFNGYLRHMIPQLQLCYPVVRNKEKMEALLVNEDTVYHTNHWGITEPKEGKTIEISNIDFLDDNGLPIQIEKKNIDDWKFTGLNITDFIDSNFYIDGFTVCVKTPVEISRVAPDRPNFSVTSGKTIIITKIISNNGSTYRHNLA